MASAITHSSNLQDCINYLYLLCGDYRSAFGSLQEVGFKNSTECMKYTLNLLKNSGYTGSLCSNETSIVKRAKALANALDAWGVERGWNIAEERAIVVEPVKLQTFKLSLKNRIFTTATLFLANF